MSSSTSFCKLQIVNESNIPSGTRPELVGRSLGQKLDKYSTMLYSYKIIRSFNLI